MERPESVIVNGIDLDVDADTAFALVSEPAELRKWFAEDVSIDPCVGGAFTFAGNGAYSPTAAKLTRFEPGRALAWTWPLHGIVGEVTVAVTPKEEAGASRIDVTSRLPELPDMPRARELVDDLWRFHLGNLKALTEGGGSVLLPDFTDPALEVRQSIHIAAPRAAVFQALIDPAMLSAWTMFGTPAVEPHVGGRYSYGWVYEAGGKTVHGGPTRILDLEQDVRLVTDWLDWRGDETNNCQTITWLLEDDAGGTRLTVIHAGFARGVDISDFPFGWIGFLEGIKAAVTQAPTEKDGASA